MSSSEEDWMDECPTDLDPRIFRRIFNMPFYTSLGDIRLLERMKKRKLTKDEKDAANMKKEESEVEDAETLMRFIKKFGKLEDEYTYKGETYSDQIKETLELLRNWSETTGMDRNDEHRGVGDHLDEMNRLEKAKKNKAVTAIQSRHRGNNVREMLEKKGILYRDWTSHWKNKNKESIRAELVKVMIDEDMSGTRKAEVMEEIEQFMTEKLMAGKKKTRRRRGKKKSRGKKSKTKKKARKKRSRYTKKSK